MLWFTNFHYAHCRVNRGFQSMSRTAQYRLFTSFKLRGITHIRTIHTSHTLSFSTVSILVWRSWLGDWSTSCRPWIWIRNMDKGHTLLREQVFDRFVMTISGFYDHRLRKRTFRFRPVYIDNHITGYRIFFIRRNELRPIQFDVLTAGVSKSVIEVKIPCDYRNHHADYQNSCERRHRGDDITDGRWRHEIPVTDSRHCHKRPPQT